MGFITHLKSSVIKQMIRTTRWRDDGKRAFACCGDGYWGRTQKWLLWKDQLCTGNSSVFTSGWKRTEMTHLGELLLRVSTSHLAARAGSIRKTRFTQQPGPPHSRSSLTSGSKTPSSLVSAGEKSKAVGWKTPLITFFFSQPIKHCTQSIKAENHMHVSIWELDNQAISNYMRYMQVG